MGLIETIKEKQLKKVLTDRYEYRYDPDEQDNWVATSIGQKWKIAQRKFQSNKSLRWKKG